MGIILNIVISFLSVLLIFIPLRYDILKNNKKSRKHKQITLFSSLTRWGWAFIILCVLTFIVSVWKIVFDDKQNENYNSTISDMKKDQKALRDSFDTFKKTIYTQNDENRKQEDINTEKILNSRPKITYDAILDIFNHRISYNLTKDSMLFSVDIRNAGNLAAKNIVDKIVLIKHDQNLVPKYIYNRNYHVINKSIQVNPNTNTEPITNYQIQFFGVNDIIYKQNTPLFVFFNLKYTSSETNKRVDKIYIVDKKGIRETNNNWYNKIATDLKSNKIW